MDRRDTDDITELKQSIEEELNEKAEKKTLSISPVDTESLQFGRDYNLGDKVTVVITHPKEVVTVEELYYFLSAYQITSSNREIIKQIQEKIEVITDVIREVTITVNQEGERIEPTIGTPETLSKKEPIYIRNLKAANKKISKLERR